MLLDQAGNIKILNILVHTYVIDNSRINNLVFIFWCPLIAGLSSNNSTF